MDINLWYGINFRKYLTNLKEELQRLPEREKKRIMLMAGATIFFMGVFFYVPPREITLAKNSSPKKIDSLNELVPAKKLGTFTYKDKKERAAETRLLPVKLDNFEIAKPARSAEAEARRADRTVSDPDADKIMALIAGRPMEKMIAYLTKRDKKVASYLVAIAKKESDWGKYSPKKSGRDCYNYWGYKGGYNLTESGYSCFDSPEQAVQVVGDRIESLLAKNINTPERLVVWKCGRSCAGHDPAGVKKWISDVALYYGKLNS
jgi:hypothetical protein